jgi:CheY-like chemotaxis protein
MNKILIIDDEINLRETLSELLTYGGYKVYEAENGQWICK